MSGANAFLDEYIAGLKEREGISGIEMNAPYIPANALAHVGLELEIEGKRIPTARYLDGIRAKTSGAFWSTHVDGSLRGEAIEYVLNTPCYITETEELLKGLWGQFTALNTKLDLSNRCSTHVHVNVGGKKINELTSLIALWTTFEEPLINWCGEDRTSNHFCLSTKNSNALIESWNNLLSGKGPKFNEGMKYSALNVRTAFTFGSFEFRTMRASEKFEPILDWTKFIHALSTTASDRYANPALLGADLSERGGREIFQSICQTAGTSRDFSASIFANQSNLDFDKLAMEGFRRAQPIVLGHPWDQWMPLINKEFVPSPFGKKGKAPKLRDEDFPDDRPRTRAFRNQGNVDPLAAEIRRNALGELVLHEPLEFPNGIRVELLEINDIRRRFRARATERFLDRTERRMDRADGYWFDMGTGYFNGSTSAEIRIRNRQELRGAPVAPPAVGQLVDLGRPLEFYDGTPAILVNYGGGRHFQARATAPKRVNATDMEQQYNYVVATGEWEGRPGNREMMIRNVQVEEDAPAVNEAVLGPNHWIVPREVEEARNRIRARQPAAQGWVGFLDPENLDF